MVSSKLISGRKFLALLGAGASMLVLASSVHAAPSATSRNFKSMSDWSINRVEPRGGSPYCTLARTFEGNTIITFARNTDGEGTVAVDFQQPLFETSQTYRIALQAGQGLKREFLTRPATPNALVLRTGQDPQFFQALTTNSEMAVILDNGRYGFKIADFKAGEKQLDNCIGVSPAGMPRAPEQESDAVTKLRADLDTLKQENAGIVASLKEQTAKPEDIQAEMSSSVENDALLKKLAGLENEKNALVEKLQNEQVQQQNEVRDEASLIQALEDQKNLQQMLQSERTQRAKLESTLTEKTAEAEKRGELRARIQQLESSNKELKSLRDTLDSERNKRIAAEQQLQAQKVAGAATLEDQERLRSRVAELETQNATLTQSSRRELATTESRAMTEQVRREATEKALQMAEMTANERQAKLTELQTQMEFERASLKQSELQKEVETSKKHAEEVARLNAEMDRLRAVDLEKQKLSLSFTAEQAKREVAEKALREAQMTASEREIRLNALQTQMEVERTKLAASERQKEDALSQQHQTEIARLTAEMEGLRKSGQENYSAEQAKREAAEKALREAQMTAAERQSKLDQLQIQMEQERNKLAASERKKEDELSQQHQTEIARLRDEMDSLRKAGQQNYSAEQARREAAEQALREAQMTADERQDKLDELQTQMERERQKLAASERKKEDELSQQHQEEINRLTSEMNRLRDVGQQNYSAEQARREAAEQALREAQSSAREAQMTAAERQDKLENLQKQMEAERQKLAASERKKEDELSEQHQTEIARLTSEMNRLRDVGQQNYSAEQARREAAEEALRAAQMTADERQAKLDDLQKQMEAERQKLAASERKKEDELSRQHQAEIARLNDEMEKMKALGAEKEELSQNYTAEQARRAAAEKALSEAQNAASERQAKLDDLQKQMEAERQKLAASERKKEDDLSRQHQGEINRLTAEMDTLRTQGQQNYTAEQARREAAEKALREVQSTADARQAKLDDLQKQMEAERQKLAASERQKEDELSRQHQAEIARLNDEMQKMKALGAEKEELSQNYTAEQARRAAAEKALQEAQVAATERQAKLDGLQAQMETERKKLEQSERQKENELSQTHQAEIARLNEEMQSLRAVGLQKEEISQSYSAEQARRAAAERELNATRAALSEKESAMVKLDAERADLIKQVEAEREAAASARVKAEDDSALKKMSAHLAELEKQNTDMVEQLQAAKMRTQAAESAAATMVPSAEAASRMAEISAQSKTDTGELRALLETEKARRQKMEQIVAQGGDSDARLREIETQMGELQKRNADLENALKTETTKATTADNESEKALKAQLDTMKADNAKLAERLAQAQAAPQTPNQNAQLAEISAKAQADRKELQNLLDTETARRQRIESMMALSSQNQPAQPQAVANTAKFDAAIAELQKRNAELEQRLKAQPAQVAMATAPSANQQALMRQLDVLKQDNESLASKLQQSAGTQNVDLSKIQGDPGLKRALLETKTSLASAVAERDEYRNLLQRERIEGAGNKGAAGNGIDPQVAANLNRKLETLETERADLIRQLEFERSKNESGIPQTASAKTAPDAALQDRLNILEAQKKALEEQLQKGQAPNADVAALLAENKKLQSELATSSQTRTPGDTRSLETEIAALRAQNTVLTDEINKRQAAVPALAAKDNAAAQVAYNAKRESAVDKTRFDAVEAENIRLSKELAAARNAPVQQPQPQVAIANDTQKQVMEDENIRLSKELAAARIAQQSQQTAMAQQSQQTANSQQLAQAQQAQAQQQARAQMARPVMSPIVDAQNHADEAMVPQQPSYAQAAAPRMAATPVSIPANTGGPSGQDIQSYLTRAGINMATGVEKIQKVSTSQFSAFRWDTGVVFGTAEQRVMPSRDGMRQAIMAYLNKTKDRCSGTFDETFDPAQLANTQKVAVADVACVMPDGNGAGAAVMFFYKDGMFNIIAHEGDIAQFDQAMNTRDRLANFLAGIL